MNVRIIHHQLRLVVRQPSHAVDYRLEEVDLHDLSRRGHLPNYAERESTVHEEVGVQMRPTKPERCERGPMMAWASLSTGLLTVAPMV